MQPARGRSSLRGDANAQIHILEMATLVWLFFMTAAFILQLEVPDSPSASVDATLLLAADDALGLADSEPAIDTANHTSRLGELLSAGDYDTACDLMLGELTSTVEGNCWIARGDAPLARHGEGAVPVGRTVTVHRLVQDSGDAWTVACQAWFLGGGI